MPWIRWLWISYCVYRIESEIQKLVEQNFWNRNISLTDEWRFVWKIPLCKGVEQKEENLEKDKCKKNQINDSKDVKDEKS